MEGFLGKLPTALAQGYGQETGPFVSPYLLSGQSRPDCWILGDAYSFGPQGPVSLQQVLDKGGSPALFEPQEISSYTWATSQSTHGLPACTQLPGLTSLAPSHLSVCKQVT